MVDKYAIYSNKRNRFYTRKGWTRRYYKLLFNTETEAVSYMEDNFAEFFMEYPSVVKIYI